jgi:hypothetical protein
MLYLKNEYLRIQYLRNQYLNIPIFKNTDLIFKR